MNKYKMITICSLSIVCILILSLLLPLTTSANDKESLELKMHYESSEVTLNIIVNSEVYTGVICKYIMVDDVLTSDNLLEQTKQTGTAINLDKNETDTYSATISNVTTRYVVIYVSIGNCNICDYIDCKPSQGETETTSQTVENNINTESENTQNTDTTNSESTNQDESSNSTENKAETSTETSNNETSNNGASESENTTDEKTASENQNNVQQDSNSTNSSEKTSTSEDKIVVNSSENTNSSEEFEVIEDTTSNVEQTPNNETQNQQNQTQTQTQTQESQEQVAEDVENVQTENKVEQNTTNNSNNSEQTSTETEAIATETTKTETTTEAGTTNSTNNSKETINVQSYDKDSINVSDFEEIEKTTTATTADENMPKTGENDTVKIMGIIIFSIISIVSFYKYQKTK